MKPDLKFFLLAFVAVIVTLAGVSSCKKDKTAPAITITYPTDTTLVVIPDSIHFDIGIAEEQGLHEMSLMLLNSNGDTVYEQYPYVHDIKTVRYLTNYFPAVAGIYTVYVTAEDHTANSATVSRSVTVQ